MAVRVKICGITNREDALIAADAGADMLGFIFYEKSPRYVTAQRVAEIARGLPQHILKVGVFVDPSPEAVTEAAQGGGLNLLQFHGNETPDFCTQFGLLSIKAFRVKDVTSLDAMADYATDAWLLDTYNPDQPGGTGETFNWELAALARARGRPVFLAGGLTPENVARAVAQVNPFAVDVSSGVEVSPGRKDAAKVRAFIKAVRNI